MATVDPVNLASLLDDAKCFALVRQHRWPEGVRCPGCGSDAVVRNGHDDTLDFPPWSGGVRSERHAAARMVIPSMLARASAGVR